MAGLQLWNSKLLVTDNGKLTADPDCCCDFQGCPPCCAQFTGGTFDVNGDLVYTIQSGSHIMTVTLIMPTKNSRIVCDTQVVAFNFVYSSTGSIPPDYSPGAFARWGQSWDFVSASPSVDSVDGLINQFGFVDWVEKPNEYSYSLKLKFNKCWTNYGGFGTFSAVELKFTDPPLDHTLSMTACPNSNSCCDEDTPCSPCCVKIAKDDIQPNGGGEFDPQQQDTLTFWDLGSGGRKLRVDVKMPDTRDRIVCDKPEQPPEQIDITAHWVAEDAVEQRAQYPDMIVEWKNKWKHASHDPPVPESPPIAGQSKDVIGAGHVDWGEKINGADGLDPFAATLILDYCAEPDEDPDNNGVTVTIGAGYHGLQVKLLFFACPEESIDCCPCNCIDCNYDNNCPEAEQPGGGEPDNIRNFTVLKDGQVYRFMPHNDPFCVWNDALPGTGPLGDDICQWWADEGDLEFRVKYNGNGIFYAEAEGDDEVTSFLFISGSDQIDPDPSGDGCTGHVSIGPITDTGGGGGHVGSEFYIEFDVINGSSC